MIGYHLPGAGLAKGGWSEVAYSLYGWNSGALTAPIDSVVFLKTPGVVVEVSCMTLPVKCVSFLFPEIPVCVTVGNVDIKTVSLGTTEIPTNITMTTIDSEVG